MANKIYSYKNGPVQDTNTNRWIVRFSWTGKDETGRTVRNEIRRQFRHKRAAERFFNETEKSLINGTLDQQICAKRLTLGKAFDLYRDSVRNFRSFKRCHDPQLRVWEREFGRETPYTEITEERILAGLKRRIEVDGIKKSTADTNLIILKSACKWLEKKKHYPGNPAKDIKLFHVDNRRLLYLLPEQLVWLLASCETEPWYVKPIIIVATLTGLRKSNVLDLLWSEVDFNTGHIRISGSKTKNGRTLVIPMCHIVKGVLSTLHRTRHERTASEFVFVDDQTAIRRPRGQFSREFKIEAIRRVESGEKQSVVARDLGIGHDLLLHWKNRSRRRGWDLRDTPIRRMVGGPPPHFVIQKAWTKVRSHSGIATQFKETRVDSFHFHDLRHTFASWQAIKGTHPFRLQELLAHHNLQSTERYMYLSELADNPGLKAQIEYMLSAQRPESPTTEPMQSFVTRLDEVLPIIFPNGAATTDKDRVSRAVPDKKATRVPPRQRSQEA